MNRTRLKFIGSAALLFTTLGVVLAVLGQLNFIGNARLEPIAVKKHQESKKNKPKYSFYDELKKRKTEIDNSKKSPEIQPTNTNKNSSGNRYVVQVGAFSKKNDANRVKQKLQGLG